MNIKFVTLTGADDWCDVDTMYSLSQKYPFVEWGILFHPNINSQSRYPSYEWVEKLRPISKEVNLSAHLCGGWATMMKYGKILFLEEPVADMFKRIQINCPKNTINEILFSRNNFWDCKFDRPFMVGGNYTKDIPVQKFLDNGISPLFDCSGGKGICPDNWKSPVKELFCGYAGGLNPINLKQQLSKIEKVVGDSDIWIDMETGVRDNQNAFDFKSCEEVLKIVSLERENGK